MINHADTGYSLALSGNGRVSAYRLVSTLIIVLAFAPSAGALGVYSAETNSLKAGVFVNSSTNSVLYVRNGKLVPEADFMLVNTSTNTVRFLWSRKIDHRIGLEMTDSNGIAVPRTRKGRRFDGKPDPLARRTQSRRDFENVFVPPNYEWIFVFANETNPAQDFSLNKSLLECFELKQPGDYKLIVTFQIYLNGPFGSRTMDRIVFSPVTVDVRVEDVPRRNR